MSPNVFVPDKAGRVQRYPIRINGAESTFTLKSDIIEAQAGTPLDDVLNDLLEIASAVFFADTSFRRGSDIRSSMGEFWRRRFDFHLAVRRPDLWSRSDVAAALADAVGFLTDDHISFQFTRKVSEPSRQPYLPYKEGSAPFQADEVILFSGGLDSFAGALEALKTRPGNIVLLTHRSAPKSIPRQENLATILKHEFHGRVLHVQVRATRSGKVSKESTQRSRSFLFAALGYAAARAFETKRVSFYENGVVSHNLPINPHVVGTMASRTTHPLALKKLRAFFDLIGPTSIELCNRFEWHTKTEVVAKIAELGGARHVEHTVSCTTLRGESGKVHHCGCCSQCFDRRFAILATGLEEFDPPSDYKVDVLTGARDTDRSRTMAIDWTRHACRLADFNVVGFGAQYLGELTRLVAAYDQDDPGAILEQAFDLQRRHGNAVRKVIEKSISKHAFALSRHHLPSSSLLVMFLRDDADLAEGAFDMVAQEPARMMEVERTDAKTFAPDLLPLRVAFYDDCGVAVVEVEGLGCVRRAPAAVAHDLKVFFDRDVAAELAPENHQYVRPHVLAKARRHVTSNTVSQSVSRCRRTLAEFYEAVEGQPPPKDLLIENYRPRGYRLDPTICAIRRDQLRG